MVRGREVGVFVLFRFEVVAGADNDDGLANRLRPNVVYVGMWEGVLLE